MERAAKPKVEAASLDVRTGTPADLAVSLEERAPRAVHPFLDDGIRGLGISPGGGQALYVPFDRMPQEAAKWLADPAAPKWVHDAKDVQAALLVEGSALEGVTFDTLLAGYLLDPAGASYPLDELCRRYLGLDVMGEIEGEGGLSRAREGDAEAGT